MEHSLEKSEIILTYFQWSDIERHLDQIVEMQSENTYQFHYPDKQPDKEYIKLKISEIGNHLESGDTYFIGAHKNGVLIGYIWGYLSFFIDEKRFNINSMLVDEVVRGSGLGKLLMNEVKKIAKKRQCDSISTYYAAFNELAGEFYRKNNFHENRIEMIYKINEV